MSRIINLRNFTIDLDEVIVVGADFKKKQLQFALKSGNTPSINYKFLRELQYAYDFILSKLNLESGNLDDFIREKEEQDE